MADQTRFGFGKNWQSFRQEALSEDRVREAERGLDELVGRVNLVGKTFLDIGSGSGLHSLAAVRLGAAKVVSFDYDPDSVECTRALQKESGAANWTVQQGSVLDEAFVRSLGEFDVVYSWGVLHHTGDMWRAIETAMLPVAKGGLFSIAIYNKVEGRLGVFSSESWAKIKRAYCEASPAKQKAMLAAYVTWQLGAVSTTTNVLRALRDYQGYRGMSWMHDAVDWLGGFPYEFATDRELIDFVEARGFQTVRCIRVEGNGWGNHQLTFTR